MNPMLKSFLIGLGVVLTLPAWGPLFLIFTAAACVIGLLVMLGEVVETWFQEVWR